MARHRNEGETPSDASDTGHEWDGIRELNNPLPRWWLWTFYATILWSIGYWIVYPAWPLVWNHTQGVFGWNSRTQVAEQIADLQAQRGALGQQFANASFADIRQSQDLTAFGRAQGRAAFATNCAQCHGTGAAGSVGYPNLNDDDWLWGGSIEQVEQTIRHGIRSEDPETRMNDMLAFGRDGILQRPDVTAVADYVRSLSNLETPAGTDLKKGEEIFKAQCVSCHGDDASGNKDVGAPNLRDAIWLYGSSRDAVIASIWGGRKGVMPHWGARLDDQTVKALAVYVHGLGGGE